MLFSDLEIISLISALETYEDAATSRFPIETKHRLIASTIQKLSNISPLTYFTKQEYEIMLLSVEYIFELENATGMCANDELYDVSKKIVDIYARVYKKD